MDAQKPKGHDKGDGETDENLQEKVNEAYYILNENEKEYKQIKEELEILIEDEKKKIQQ